jgi:hypothetical protein
MAFGHFFPAERQISRSYSFSFRVEAFIDHPLLDVVWQESQASPPAISTIWEENLVCTFLEGAITS